VDKIKQIGLVIFKINKSIWLPFVFFHVNNINALTNLPSLDNATITTILWFAIIVGSWTNHPHTKILLFFGIWTTYSPSLYGSLYYRKILLIKVIILTLKFKISPKNIYKWKVEK